MCYSNIESIALSKRSASSCDVAFPFLVLARASSILLDFLVFAVLGFLALVGTRLTGAFFLLAVPLSEFSDNLLYQSIAFTIAGLVIVSTTLSSNPMLKANSRLDLATSSDQSGIKSFTTSLKYSTSFVNCS